jgi:ABC-type transporter Mla MlaB component
MVCLPLTQKKALDLQQLFVVTCSAMTRTFSAVALVHLPRVDSNGAVALASSIESAAGQFNDLTQTSSTPFYN